jgi:gamma-glutamyltranspeptidase/glutathione hydrolase
MRGPDRPGAERGAAQSALLPLGELLGSRTGYYVDLGYEYQPTMLQVVGGMDRLPQALAVRVRDKITYHAAVREIRQSDRQGAFESGRRVATAIHARVGFGAALVGCVTTWRRPIVVRIPGTRSRKGGGRMKRLCLVVLACALLSTAATAISVPVRSSHGIVVTQNQVASQIGAAVLREGGTAVDAVVATAFALAVVHPTAGNIGGGGFLVYRPAKGDPVAFDFREKAPAGASATMFLRDGKYDAERHHNSHLAVGVPGTVAGLHLAWSEHGRLPWRRLVEPAVALARDGFVVTDGLSRSLKGVLDQMRRYPASVAQFTRNGIPYEAGETLKQPDLARTLARIAAQGPEGFYAGDTAMAIEREMLAHGGLITRDDLRNYRAVRRAPVTGTYRGHDVIAMPPPSSGGVALIGMLNVIEGYDLAAMGAGSASAVHLMAESMKRAFADRARHLGDPDFNPDIPVTRLLSKAYAADLRMTIRDDRTVPSSPATFEWPREGEETTHVSAVDAERNAVAMTYTLEQGYGVKIVVPGAGFLLNNEMGDFNAGPGLTTVDGLIGTDPNLAAPNKRMLSSMTPTIVAKDGRLLMVTGSPGGRTIINTVLQTIVNVVDFRMNAQEAVDAARFHHQWLPDRIGFERNGLSPDTIRELERRGHTLQPGGAQGAAQVIVYDAREDLLEAGTDRRVPDGAAVPSGARARR